MTTLENEVKLDALTMQDQLTNVRVVQEIGSSYKNSIFLEKISSVQVLYRSKPIYLILGAIAIVLGIWTHTQSNSGLTYGLLAGAIFIVAFFLTRKHVVSITPDAGIANSIFITVKGIGKARIEQFITNVQKAKLARTTIN